MRDKKGFGTRVTLIRNTLNETLEEFGRRFNTSKTTVYNWEIGRNLPNNQNFEILKKMLKILVFLLKDHSEVEEL